MTLEMGQNNVGAIVLEMLANEIAGQARTAGDGDFHAAVLVQNLKIRDLGVAVILRNLIVLGGCRTEACVGCVAFDNRSVDQMHQISNQLRPEIVAVGRLTGGELYCDRTGGVPVQCLIDRDKSLRRDVVRKIDDGLLGFVCVYRTAGEYAKDKAQGNQQGKRFFHNDILLFFINCFL